MRARTEKLGTHAAVKGAMMQAHLGWAAEHIADAAATLSARVGPEAARVVAGEFLITDWIPFRVLIEVDRAIAAEVGGAPETVYRRMGRQSAERNLSGVYKTYIADEPHRFFERATRLHGRFQNFGRSEYTPTGDRSGQRRITGYAEYSPVFCASALGYYEGVLHLMKVPGPVAVTETECQCAGDPACVYELSW